jgi:hypothetical protein
MAGGRDRGPSSFVSNLGRWRRIRLALQRFDSDGRSRKKIGGYLKFVTHCGA